MPAQRIPLFDVAKALLIISVFVYHVPAIYLGWMHGANETMGWLDGVNVRLVNSFFMAGFFCISGYFLNVQKPLLQCIAKDARTLSHLLGQRGYPVSSIYRTLLLDPDIPRLLVPFRVVYQQVDNATHHPVR